MPISQLWLAALVLLASEATAVQLQHVVVYAPNLPQQYSITYGVVYPGLTQPGTQPQFPKNFPREWRPAEGTGSNLRTQDDSEAVRQEKYLMMSWIFGGLVIVFGFGGEIRQSQRRRKDAEEEERLKSTDRE